MSEQDSLEKLKKEYFTNISEEVDRIYVDMELLQDLKIGALLQTATVPEEIEYIQSCIPTYNCRFDLETASHFPVLKTTDEKLLEIMKKNPKKTAMISPWTKIYSNFHIVLKYLYLKSTSTHNQATPLNIVVNCADISYPIQLFDMFAKQIEVSYPGATVKLAYFPRYKGTDDFYLDFDMFFLYDHETFFGSSFITRLINSPKYKTRVIYTTPYVNKKMGLDPSEYMKGLESTGSALNLFFDFYYMPTGINWVGVPNEL